MADRGVLLFNALNRILRFSDLPSCNGNRNMSESDLEGGIRATLDRAKKWVDKEYGIAVDLHVERIVAIKEAENLLDG